MAGDEAENNLQNQYLVKTADEIKIMLDANQIVAETLSMLFDVS